MLARWLRDQADSCPAPSDGWLRALAAHLGARSNKRVPLDTLRRVHLSAFPAHREVPDLPARLLRMLEQLAAAEVLTLPKTKAAWDRSTAPALPRYVQLKYSAPDVVKPREVVAWDPRLAFAALESHPGRLEVLRTLNDYLIRTAHRELPNVPLHERSWLIFGDEKRLDGLLNRGTDTLFGGQIELAVLRCFRVPLPLTHVRVEGAPAAILVVENLDSYWSFCAWNEQARRYSAIAFGNGNAFVQHREALAVLAAEIGVVRVDYLGDLDPTGVRIPVHVQTRLPAGLELVPCRWGYQHLLAQPGRRSLSPQDRKRCEWDSAQLLGWFGPDLGEAVLALFTQGQWIPQEALGLTALLAGALEAAASPPAGEPPTA